MTNQRLEYCSACGEPTGNAGAGDGSIFWLDGAIGPLCPECNNTLRSEVLDDCCKADGVGEPSEWIRDVLKWGANLKPDIELAQLANDGAEFREDFCTCDPSVGMSPCQYCAIHDALRRTLKLSQHCAALLDAIEGRGGTIDEILAALAKREERG